MSVTHGILFLIFRTETNKNINYAFDYKEALYCQVPFHGKSGKALKCKEKKTCIFNILFYLQITVCIIMLVVAFTYSFSSILVGFSPHFKMLLRRSVRLAVAGADLL